MHVRFSIVFIAYLSLKIVVSNGFDEPISETSSLEEMSSSYETNLQDLNWSSESPVTDSSDLFSDMDLANTGTKVPWDNLYTLSDATVQSSCASLVNGLNLEARDDASCRPPKDTQPILTPEMLQLSKDPVGLLENMILPKKGQAPGSPGPSEQDPRFPDLFSDKEVRQRLQTLFDEDADPCAPDDDMYIFNACCDGPCEGISIPPVFADLIKDCELGITFFQSHLPAI